MAFPGPSSESGQSEAGLWALGSSLTEPSRAKLGASELNRSDFRPAGFAVSDVRTVQ